MALVVAMIGNRREADDIAQEAFARALMRWPRVGVYDLPGAWVRRVALRLAVDADRRFRGCGQQVRAMRTSARLAAAERRAPDDSAEPGGLQARTPLGTALMRVPGP